MGVSLKYDIDDFATEKKNVSELKDKIDTARNTMKAGLNQLRSDWVSEGGEAFFESIDDDWENSIQSCIDVLEDIVSALEVTETKYGEIETNATTYLKF